MNRFSEQYFRFVLAEEDLMKPRKRFNKRRYTLTLKMSEYSESFTAHGLSRIIAGNRYEKFFWTVSVLTAAAVAVYAIRGYILKYSQHDVYYDYSTVATKKAYFPIITFCVPYFRFRYQNYCGRNYWYYFNKRNNGAQSCMTANETCNVRKRTASKNLFWRNGVFNVRILSTLSSDEDISVYQLNPRNFYSDKNFRGLCFSWNKDRQLFDDGSGVHLDFLVGDDLFDKPDALKVNVYIHEDKIDPELLIPHMKLLPGKKYQLTIKKTHIKRLPTPHPSNCTHKTNSHYFQGAYNKRSCHIMERYKEQIKKYGVINDEALRHLPQEMKAFLKANITYADISNVRIEASQTLSLENPSCPLACDEVNYETSSYISESNFEIAHEKTEAIFEPKSNNECVGMYQISEKFFYSFGVNIQFQNQEFYHLMEEKKLYSWEQMLAEIGGIVGLLIGMSALSLIEILSYIGLAIMKKLA